MAASAAGMPFVNSTSIDKADPEMRKLIRSHCMLGKNRGKILHSRRKPKREILVEATSAVPNKLGSELSLLQFADSVEPSTLWEVLLFTSTSKQMFFPLVQCFDFKVIERSMFDPLTYDTGYLNAVIFGAQAYMDMFWGRSRKGSLRQMLKTIQLLRTRLSISDGNTPISDPTILIVLTLAHIAHLSGEYITAEQHLQGLHKIITLRGGIAAFQNNPKLLTELLRCDISIAIHKGTRPIFAFDQSLQFIRYLPQIKSSSPPIPCLDDKLAEIWDTLRNFCSLVNSVAAKNSKLSDQILLNTMGSVMYALLGISFSTDRVNEGIRLGMLAFCSHSFLERRGIHLPNGYLYENYRTCFEDINSRPWGNSLVSLWLLMIGKISIFVFDTDDSAWIRSSLREQIGINEVCAWPQLRQILKSFLWIDILHDEPGRKLFESINLV